MCARTADDAEGRFVTKFNCCLLVLCLLLSSFSCSFVLLFSRVSLGSLLLASSVTSYDNPYMNDRSVSFSITTTLVVPVEKLCIQQYLYIIAANIRRETQ